MFRISFPFKLAFLDIFEDVLKLKNVCVGVPSLRHDPRANSPVGNSMSVRPGGQKVLLDELLLKSLWRTNVANTMRSTEFGGNNIGALNKRHMLQIIPNKFSDILRALLCL